MFGWSVSRDKKNGYLIATLLDSTMSRIEALALRESNVDKLLFVMNVGVAL